MPGTSFSIFSIRSFIKLILVASSLALSLAGCAAKVVKPEPVFFPPPPDAPRIQFLKGILNATDVQGEQNSFSLFLSGGNRDDNVKPIAKPYGIAAHKGKIYVCDSQGPNVVIMDPSKKSWDYLKGNINAGRMKKPVNITFDSQDNIYVADVGRLEILMYNPAGEFIRAYGKELQMKSVDVLVDDQNLYILDMGSNEIKVLDRKSGELLRSMGKIVDNSPGLSIPTNITFDAAGNIYATNLGMCNVVKLDKDGHVISTFGKMGDAFGEFARPKGIFVDSDEWIYVVDAAFQNVQMFDGKNKNRLLVFFGDPPLPNGAMNLPAGITVTTDNLEYYQTLAAPGFIVEKVIFVTNQLGRHRVAIYGFGHMKEGLAPPQGATTPQNTPQPQAEPQKQNEKKPEAVPEKK